MAAATAGDATLPRLSLSLDPLSVPASGGRRLGFSHFFPPFPAGRLEEPRRRRRGRRAGVLTDADTKVAKRRRGFIFCLYRFHVEKVVIHDSHSAEGGLGMEQRRLLGLLL